MCLAVSQLAAGALNAPRKKAEAPARRGKDGPNPLSDSEINGLSRLITEVDTLLLQVRQCDWRIAQARAYLARPDGRNLSLGAIRLAELRHHREGLVERLEQLDLDAK